MAADDELMMDAADDARVVDYIRTHIPQELQERLTDETLYYLLDVLVEYYADSDLLDAEPDDEGFVSIDVDAIAEDIAKIAHKEGFTDLTAEDIAFVVEAHLDAEEQDA